MGKDRRKFAEKHEKLRVKHVSWHRVPTYFEDGQSLDRSAKALIYKRRNNGLKSEYAGGERKGAKHNVDPVL